VVNIYNGGGVASAILIMMASRIFFLQAIWFSCKLYLNKGNFKFEDITDAAVFPVPADGREVYP